MKNFLIICLLSCSHFVIGQNEKVIISFFGSSVCKGSGAEDNKGYAWQFYNRNAVDTTKYAYTNVSTGGDNTIKVEKLDRLTNKLYPAQPDIVLIGLSLANEGISWVKDESGRERIFEQFRSRLKALADSLDNYGIQVVIVNCYAHSYFSPDHYRFTKKMNRELNTWKYPVVNVLGTIDDWRGRWVEGFYRDPGHPNKKGHEEMSYAIVPSLFDAIKLGKKQPVHDWKKNYTTLINPQEIEKPLSIVINNTMHSFSVSFRFKEAKEGSIAGFNSNNEQHNIEVKENAISYKKLKSRISQQDNDWTHVVLAHSYANEQTMLIINGSLAGIVNEKLSPSQFHFGGTTKSIDLKDLALHRSCLNTDEAMDLYNKKFIPASLEFYNPLTKPIDGSVIENNAQSLTKGNVDKQVNFNHHNVTF